MARLLLYAMVGSINISPALLQATDPCQSNTIFPGTSLRSFDNVQAFSDIKKAFCDISLRDGWYRLKVDDKDFDLAQSAPSPGACNTNYPIWMNGSVPQTLSQETPARACMVTSGNSSCGVSLDIKVVNCTEYNVYYLRPANACPAAYCFDIRAPCPEGTSSETGTYPDCSDNFPHVNVTPAVEPLLGKSTENTDFEDLRFKCNFTSPDPSYFYDVVWRINGDEVTRMIKLSPADLPVDAQLLETVWKDRYKLGINVRCSVRIRASEHGLPSPEYHSDEFFAGLKALNRSVLITEGESIMIQYQATVPVPCPINFDCGVFFIDYAYEKINEGCERNKRGNCGFAVSAKEWNAVSELRVTGDYDNRYGNRLAEIFLKSANPAPGGPLNVWTDVSPQVVLVNIHDKEAKRADAYCLVHNDPHFHTFDGRDFDVHLGGQFVLYRHKTLPLEVRGFFQPCSSGSSIYCVCGGAVRSGKQIFVWSQCKDNRVYQTTFVRVYGCNQRQMRVTQNGNFKVELPNGMVVTMTGGHIHITPSAADFNQVTGLCGNFNGDDKDEHIDPEGKKHNECQYCNDYGLTWMITNDTQSYYGYPDDNLEPAPIGRCFCNASSTSEIHENVTCINVPEGGCGTLDPEVTEEYCTQIPGSPARRRKRQAEKNDDGLNDDDVRPVFPSYNVTDFVPPQWTNGWNEEKARVHCLKFYRQSPAFDPCLKVPNVEVDPHIDSCVMDILLTGTTDWTLSSLETFKGKCVSEVRRNTTLWVAENSEPSVLTLVMEASCPEECSYHGNCTQGKCQCEAGWIGDDCSVDMSQPPEVLGLPKRGLCDIRNRYCDRTLVYGKRFAGSESLTCKFEQVFVNNGTTELQTPTTVFITQAYYRHSDEIVCSLPSYATIGTDETGLPVGYYLSVSNYNDVFSRTLLFLPYHSEEFNCFVVGMEASCEKIAINTGFPTNGMDISCDKKEGKNGPKSASPFDKAVSSFMIIMICGMKWALID